MVRFMKQLGKAGLYMGTMVSMQFLAYFIFMFSYLYELTMELETGAVISRSAEELGRSLYDYLLYKSSEIYILYGIMTLAVFWFIFAIRKKSMLKEARILLFRPKKIIPILLLGISCCMVIQWAFIGLPIPQQLLEEYNEAVSMTMGGSLAMILLTNVVIAPIVEEITFRGLAMSRLAKIMPISLAAVLTSGIFGLIHGQILWILYASALGLMMSLVAVQCESVLASILFHMVFNLFGSFPILEAALGFSEEGMILAGIVASVVGIGSIIWLVRDRKKDWEQLQ